MGTDSNLLFYIMSVTLNSGKILPKKGVEFRAHCRTRAADGTKNKYYVTFYLSSNFLAVDIRKIYPLYFFLVTFL